MLKQNKGITLVALVITIIVLLILAGVSISLVVGDNGVLTRAGDSSEKTAYAQAKEAVEMAVVDAQNTFVGEWEKDTSSYFIKWFKGFDGVAADGKVTLSDYIVNYTPSTGNSKTGNGIGQLTVNGKKLYFKLTGTSNGLGAIIKWCDDDDINSTSNPFSIDTATP